MLDLRTRTMSLTCLALLLILVLVTACGGTPTPTLAPPDPTETTEPEPTAPPEPTATAPRPTSSPRPSTTAARATSAPPRAVTPTVSGKPTEPPLVLGGASFARVGLDSQSIAVLAVGGKDGQVLYAGGKGVSRSTDGGKTWKVVRTEKEAPKVAAIAIAPSDPQVVYVGISEGCAKGKPQQSLITIDGGATWKPTGLNLTSIAIDPKDPQKAYVADCNGLERTKDRGATWEVVERADVDNFAPKLIARAPSTPQTIYIVGSGEGGASKVQRTDDDGVTWQDVTPQIELIGPLSIAIDPTTPNTVFLSTLVGIVRSVDSGLTWSLLSGGGLEVTIPANPPETAPEGIRLTSAIVADPDKAGLFWVGTGAGKLKGLGVYRTRDGGEEWERSGKGIEGRLVQALAIGGARNSRVLYAATDDGVWMLTSP